MKKSIAVLLFILFLVNICGCSASVDPQSDTTTSATSTGTTTGTTKSVPDNSVDWEGVGGNGYGANRVYGGGQKFDGLMNGFYTYVREKHSEDLRLSIVDELREKYNAIPNQYTGESMHFWVRRLNIPRETFEEINAETKESFSSEWDIEQYVFTDQEIDDIYNLSIKEFNQKYKSPTAALVGETLYPFYWFLTKPVDLWLPQGFTIEQLQEILTNAKANPHFPDRDIAIYEKKLNDYIASVGEA